MEVGPEAARLGGFQPGDRVVVNPPQPCNACVYCRKTKVNLCEHTKTVGTCVDGGFAEYVKVGYANVLHLPEGMSFEEGAMAEPLACGCFGVQNLDVQLGDVVVVIGAGAIGLMMAQLIRMRGAGKVIVTDVVDHCLDMALQVGADHAFNMLTKFYVEEKQEDLSYIADSIDWEANLDPEFKKNHYHEPIPVRDLEEMRKEGYEERWVVYGSAGFSAKELVVLPGQTVTIRDSAAYGLIMMQGYGLMNGMNIETPAMIGYEDLTADEMYVCANAAKNGVVIQNFSKTNPIVMLKHFGPGNPDAAQFLS